MADDPEQGLLWSTPLAEASKDHLKVVGIDENGLGPRLGPLVVTGAALELPETTYEPSALWKAFSGLVTRNGRPRVDDSKAVSAFRSMAEAETLVHALARLCGASGLDTADRFLAAVTLTPFETLCPAPSRAPCFTDDPRLPLFARPEGFEDAVLGLAEDVRACLDAAGASLLGLRSTLYCPFRYNAFFAHAPEARKSHLNLSAFEEVIRHFSESFDEQALFLCGKVMNLKYYAKYFSYLSAFDLEAKEETHLVSQYRLAGLGEVRFVHDGDRLDLPISLASIVGKYAREIYVRRMNRFFLAAFPDLKAASGYNDKVTKQLIARIQPRLADLSVDPSCFLRCK